MAFGVNDPTAANAAEIKRGWRQQNEIDFEIPDRCRAPFWPVAACSEEPASPEAAAANSGGSTAAAVDQSTLQYFQQTVGDSVFFATNASSISPRARQTLQRQAQWLNANLAVNAQIAGHADERGTREFNLGAWRPAG